MSHRAATLFPPGEGQTLAESGLFPRENGRRDLRGDCEGTARDLILRN